MLTLGLPMIVALIGALVYGLAVNGKAAELGRIMFCVGLLWALYAAAYGGIRLRM